MLLHEIFSLFGSLDDYLLMEGFKDDMFKDCKLDLKSLKRIATTLPSANEESKITLGLESTKGEFAKYIQIIKDKGWTVEV